MTYATSRNSMTLVVLAGVICSPRISYSQVDSAPAEWSLERVRTALEAAWSETQTRHIRVSQTPWNVADADASPDHPDRTEIDIIATGDGKHLVTTRSFQNNQPSRLSVEAFDGKRRTSISHWPPTDAHTVEVTLHQVPLQTTGVWGLLTLSHVGKPFHEMLRDFPSRVVGTTEVGGVRCIRVETIAPAGHNGRQTKTQILLDLDPDKGLWPRRILSRLDTDPSDVFNYTPGPMEALDFANMDGTWFPTAVRMRYGGKEPAFQYVVHAEFNRQYPLDTFQPQGPAGAIVHDQIQKNTYIQGGEAGRQLRRQQVIASLGNDQGADEPGTPVSTAAGRLASSSMLLFVGIVLLLTAAILSARVFLKRRQ